MKSRTFWALFFVALTCSTLAAPRTTHAVSEDKLDDATVGRDHEQHVGRSRQKRFVGLALGIAGLVVGVVGTGVTIGAYVDAKVNDPAPEIISTLGEIKAELQQLSNTLDLNTARIMHELRSLHQEHDITRVASLFGDDVLRLNYFKLLTDNSANYNATTNQIIVNEQSEAWVDAVLSESSDGMHPVLYNIHRMITGSTFAKPIRDVYMNGLLLSGDDNIWQEMDELAETLTNMQNMGYSLWTIALDLAGRTSEITSTVVPLMEQRSAAQQGYLRVDEQLKYWPQGSYGLVQTKEGCPDGQWSTGSRYHDTEDDVSNNGWSPSNLNHYLEISYGVNDMSWYFCMKQDINSSPVTHWPSGKYCIFESFGACPAGFSRGSLYLDDEDDNNGNSYSGSVPWGQYDRDTKYYFCCRYDGREQSEIRLPVSHPFVLFPLQGYSCPRVQWMTSTRLFFYWDCEDDNNINSRAWPHPYEENNGRNMLIRMCYYHATTMHKG